MMLNEAPPPANEPLTAKQKAQVDKALKKSWPSIREFALSLGLDRGSVADYVVKLKV